MSGSATPTLSGFIWFIQNVMGINAAALPTTSPVIAWCLAVSQNYVNPDLAYIGNALPGLPATNLYVEATYNLAGDYLLNVAQDQPGITFFADAQKTMNLTTFVAGVVSAASDESTSTSILNTEAMKGFTLANLQNLKTPWGRRYLAIAQSAGPTIWGLT